MTYDPDKHHRRSIRLQGFDYSRSAAYFVTICVQNRECLFGMIPESGQQVILNDAGWYQQSG
jgi:putative transposase